ERDETERVRVLPDLGLAHVPARIDEDQIGGPEQLPEVEPARAAREKRALDRRQMERRALRADEPALDVGREKPRRDPRRDERHERYAVAPPVDSPPPPPEPDHQPRGA